MRRGAFVLLAYLLFVVYGSLVPLDFRPQPLDHAWQGFLNAPFLHLGVESRADWIANGVLYAPLGLLVASALRRWMGAAWAGVWPLAWLACAGVAVAVEFAQMFFPPRTVSLNDLLAEGIGAAVGAGLAPVARGWSARVQAAWAHGAAAWVTRALELYLAAYVLLAFFPYDVLLSASELASRLATGNAAWWLVPQSRGELVQLVMLATEVVLALPLGVLVRRLRPGVSVGGASMLGLALGVAMELGQLLIASGVSQGASAVARAVGVGLGAAVAWRVNGAGLSWVRSWLARHGSWLALPYLVLLLAVNGWMRGTWRGPAEIAKTWTELRLLPFYYHYYTSEAVALFSLGSVVLMYLPVAVLGWARGWTSKGVGFLVALLALAVESAKLFMPGLHPDPTNVLIAAVTASLGRRLLDWRPASPSAARADLLVPSHDRRGGNGIWLVAPAYVLALGLAWGATPFRGALIAALVLSAVAVAWRPAWALALLPLGMLALDLAPWTGHRAVDEFDALLLVVLPTAWARIPRPDDGQRHPSAGLGLPMGLLGASLLASVAMAFAEGTSPSGVERPVFNTAMNAVFIAKGAAWAWVTVRVWRRLGPDGPALGSFGLGMGLALAWCSAWVVWERLAFGLTLDLEAPFRVSGPISAMHRGGAYLECFLVVAITCTLGLARRARGRAAPWLAGVVALAGCGALVVTYSRNGYVALLVSMMVWGLAVAVERPRHGMRRAVPAVAAVLGVGLVGWLVLSSPFARERLAGTQRELAVRMAHWTDAVNLRPDGVLQQVFGAGLGRFPDLHFWNSREDRRAASLSLVQDKHDRFLRLGPGATLYLEQVLTAGLPPTATLSVDVRSAEGVPQLQVMLCRKWLLTSRDCRNVTLAGNPDVRGWQTLRQQLPAQAEAGDGWGLRPPLVLSLLTPGGKTVVEVRRVALRSPDGRDGLANGTFDQGFDRWFFSTDVDPPWHIHSLPVAIWFDQGWLGVLAWGLVGLWTLVRGARLVQTGMALAPEALAAVAGFGTSGLVNTLIDSPRFLWLLLVLVWLGLQSRPALRARRGEPQV